MRFLIAAFSSIALIACRQKEVGTVPASAAPPKPLTVFTKEGISVPSYDFKSFEPQLLKQTDTTYVVNFWATWCAPCIAELPHFEKINTDYKNRKIKVLLVSLDFKKQVESNLLPFIKRKNLRSEVIHLSDPDANAWISRVDPSWSGAIPATLIYNKNKRTFYEQTFTFEQLQTELLKFN